MARSQSALHALLLLSDSALPLGSFAFSSGLESFLAHHKYSNASEKFKAFELFLEHSLLNIGSTAVPYVISGYNDPTILETLDNDFDASTPCTVARRASVSQGKALLTIWEKSLSVSTASTPLAQTAADRLSSFAVAIKSLKPDDFGLQLNAHFPPLFGIACAALGLSSEEALYLFLLNHAKAILSAAVRASVMGPYQSQAVLASGKLQDWIVRTLNNERDRVAENAAVTVPAMDLWMGRHELLYSRIFNS